MWQNFHWILKPNRVGKFRECQLTDVEESALNKKAEVEKDNMHKM